MLCNTFNGQLFRDGQHCNVFLAGAQECWAARRLIASLLPHTNMLPGWSLWTWWSDFMNVLKLDSSLALIFACVCLSSSYVTASDAPFSLGLHPLREWVCVSMVSECCGSTSPQSLFLFLLKNVWMWSEESNTSRVSASESVRGTKGTLWCLDSCGRWIIRSRASPAFYPHYTHSTCYWTGRAVSVYKRAKGSL